jgi:FSR family fosmidomycin resistance protein-like MFS transporter
MATIATDTRRDRLAYWFSAGHLCIDFPIGAIYVIAPVVALAYGWSPADVGLLLMVQSVVSSLAYPPAGLLMDATRRRGLILAMTFFWVAAGYFLASFSDGFWVLAALLALAAIGDAAWHPMATGILMKSAPGRRARVLGIHAIGGAMAVVVAPLATGILLEHFDWRTTFNLVLIPTLGMGILFLLHVSRQVPALPIEDREKPDFRALLRDWTTARGLKLAAMMMLFNLGLVGAVAMTPLFLKTGLNFDIGDTGLVFALILLGGAVVQPFVGTWSDRIGRRSIIVIAAAAGAIGATIAFSASGPVIPLAGVFLAIGALTAVRSVVLACAVDLSGKSEATTLGIAFAVLDGIGAFGAVLAGLLGEIDIAHAYILTAVCSGGAALMAMAALPRRHGAGD